ncbi:hypothetical protein GGI07_003943 [Coemansia sp. Benny D115]|nr:hypothetical protein GGI07_003943 [Coemansia sp. Benny D115]
MDSFESYINPSLVDDSGAAEDAMGAGAKQSFGTELLLQLLLSTVSPTAADSQTIDPTSLTAMDPAAAAGVANSDELFTAALLSALGPLPDAVNSADIATLHAADAMLVDEPEAEAGADNAAATAATAVAAARTTPAAPAHTSASVVSTGAGAGAGADRQSTQQQAPGAATGRRSMGAKVAAAATKPAPPARRAPAPTSVPNTSPPPPPAPAPAPAAASTSSASAKAGARIPESPGLADVPEDAALEDVDMEGIDVKSLSSKERRQLRNKISARNFRVRRKEYISTLEAEVRQVREENDGLKAELAGARKDNSQLRDELQKLRHRISQLSQPQQQQQAAQTTAASGAVLTRPPQIAANGVPAAPLLAGASSSSSAHSHAPKAPVPVPAASPMPRFNPHKDIGQVAAKKTAAQAAANGTAPSAAQAAQQAAGWAAKNSRSGFIAVNTAILPESHAGTFDRLVCEARRQRSVDALLGMQPEPAIAALPSPSPSVLSPGDHEVLVAAAGVLAEFALFQIAIESSLALARESAVASAASQASSAALFC